MSRPFLAGAGDGDLVPLLLEGVLDAARDGVLVFDDQDGGGHGRDATPGARPRRDARAGDAVATRGTLAPLPGASPPRPRRRAAARRPTTGPNSRGSRHANRPRDAGRRTSRDHRQEGRPPAPRRPPARGRLRPWHRVRQHHRRCPRRSSSSAAIPARTPSSTCRSTARRRSRSWSTSVQVHPVNRRPLHVDLFLVRMTEELTVDVPLVATVKPSAVTQHGGTLLHPIESVRVRALPDHLPAVDRVLDRVARRLRHGAPRARPLGSLGRDAR